MSAGSKAQAALGALSRALAATWRGAGVALDAGRTFQANEGFILAGYVAFAGLLALFPFAIFIASFAAATTGPEEIEALRNFLVEALPKEIEETVGPPLANALSLEGRGVVTLSALGAVWAASNGVEAFRVSFDRAYRTETPRHFLLNRLIGMAAVVVGAVAATLMGFAVVLGPLILRMVEGLFGIEQPFGLGLVRYLVALLAFLALLRLMHGSLPRRRTPRLWPGIFATVAIWTAAASGFSAYLAVAPSYAGTYGALSGVIVSLLFFYLSGAVIIYGAEINAALDRRTRAEAEAAGTDPARDAEAPEESAGAAPEAAPAS